MVHSPGNMIFSGERIAFKGGVLEDGLPVDGSVVNGPMDHFRGTLKIGLWDLENPGKEPIHLLVSKRHSSFTPENCHVF